MTSIQEMLEEVDMEDYLYSEGVTFRKGSGQSGVQLNVRECPFCGGKEWKVYMNAETGLGNCFHGSCGQTFNKFTFVRALTGTDNSNTIRILKDYLHQTGWRPKRKTPFVQTVTEVALPESEPIAEGSLAYEYLAKRGFGSEDIEDFGWTYCKWGSIPIIRADGTPGEQYFNGRIIIPVTNLEGELKTFQGRDITGESDFRYLFPRGYPATGRYLYNAQNERGKATLVVGEGAFDVAAIKAAMRPDRVMAETHGAVGTFGKHMSKTAIADQQDQFGEFIKLKEEGLERVIFMWDSERKALMDAYKTAMQLQSLGLAVSVARLPSGRDPNEVNAEVIRALIRMSRDLRHGEMALELAKLTFSKDSV